MADAPLLERLRAHLAASRLFGEPGLAVLAVSGGGDSLALLDLLAALAPELGLGLVVAHADHGILPGSAGVAGRVAALARERYALETVTAELRLGPAASETRARLARYRFLRAVQAERRARYVVTAHHADDQVETVLLRVLRGSGPAGLAGIEAAGPRGLVRPLLPFRHAELLAHAEGAGLEIFRDPSNADTRHARAWIRTALRPAIEDRLGGTGGAALLAVAAHAARDLDAWDAVLDRLPGLDLATSEGRFEVARPVLRGYDNALAARVLRAAARRAHLRLTPAEAARLAAFASRAASGRALALAEGVASEAAFDRLVVTRRAPVPEARALDAAGGEVAFGPLVFAWRSESAPAAVPRGGWTTWVEAGRLGVRASLPGDRVLPVGGVGRRKVARLLMEARVPRSARAAYPVVTSGDEVVWLPGVCRAAVRIPRPGTEAVRIDARAG
ncbi:MAG TPA: tRNA lysidine(34) synthetase TilS [Gemmatimonadales bacterium]|nr:tRNA lysidine(34) synthetase TilS [Gemmatimonadales bacterium]